jgi:putative ABC transport system permease protein
MQAVGGMSGRLGRENAMRNPQRTAQTASALTIGVALVAGVTVFAASLYQTFAGTLDDRILAQVVVTSQSQQPFSPAAADSLRTDPQLVSVSGWRSGRFRDADGEVQDLSGLDPQTLTKLYDAEITSGSMEDLAQPDTIAVNDDFAADHGLAVGSTMPALFTRTGQRRLRVVAVFEDTTFGGFYVSRQQFERDFTTQQDVVLLARARPGIGDEQAKAAAERSLRDYPNLEVRTKAEYKDFVSGQINQFLYLFYVLLALAIVIAVFGIVLTLALSVFERTREIGLLRAVGLSRRSARAMIRWEAVIVCLIGAVVGLVLGVFLGIVTVLAVPDLTALAVPWGSLAVFLVLAALVGVPAAILPARRAARLNVLEAIQAV